MHQQISVTAPENNHFWDSLLSSLSSEFGELTYKNWFSHLSFLDIDEGVLYLSAPTRFISEWIETNYGRYIVSHASKFGVNVSRVDIKVIPSNNPRPVASVSSAAQEQVSSEKCDIFDFNIDPRFTFENFVVGASNKVAASAAKMIAEKGQIPGSSNILYIHSPVGFGKTHLLQATTSYIKQHSPNKRVAYLSAEKFLHMYLKSLRNNELVSFKEKMKSCDVLLIDDIQFICGKNATQQEFGNLLSALIESNKTVVISADVNPFALNLDNRSKSRLVGGLVVEIQESPYELRLEILKSKAKAMDMDVSEDVLHFIASNIASSNRELEGAFSRIVTYSSFEGTPPSLEMAQTLLNAHVAANKTEISIQDIVSKVAQYFDITDSDVKSKSRAAKFTIPRQICAYLSKTLTTNSLVDIGFALGKRDHASVIYYIKQIEKRIAEDSKLQSQVLEIRNSIK